MGEKQISPYSAKTLNGSHTVNLSDFKGKSVLFINVATY
uniref:Glutathione peroxidase n=1 Tax=Cyclopterus lumpus TaxID=8103 RepID=A0A8C2X6B6_CYCLU